jgi:hypothetical protein
LVVILRRSLPCYLPTIKGPTEEPLLEGQQNLKWLWRFSVENDMQWPPEMFQTTTNSSAAEVQCSKLPVIWHTDIWNSLVAGNNFK